MNCNYMYRLHQAPHVNYNTVLPLLILAAPFLHASGTLWHHAILFFKPFRFTASCSMRSWPPSFMKFSPMVKKTFLQIYHVFRGFSLAAIRLLIPFTLSKERPEHSRDYWGQGFIRDNGTALSPTSNARDFF